MFQTTDQLSGIENMAVSSKWIVYDCIPFFGPGHDRTGKMIQPFWYMSSNNLVGDFNPHKIQNAVQCSRLSVISSDFSSFPANSVNTWCWRYTLYTVRCFQPLWKIWKSIGMIIPNIWENKFDGNQTTNQLYTVSDMFLDNKDVMGWWVVTSRGELWPWILKTSRSF